MPPAPTYSRRAMLKLVGGAALLPVLRPVAALAAPPAFQLAFPQDPLLTEFVDSFGVPRSGGRRHQGNDLMAPKMTPVYSAASGVVRSIGEGGIAGRRIIIDHIDGWQSWYLHLNNDAPGSDNGNADWSDTLADGIAEGSMVTAGQQIGWVGDSGNAEWVGPHTHFELHRNGEVVDPYPYLRPAYHRALRRAQAPLHGRAR